MTFWLIALPALGFVLGWEGHKYYLRKLVKAMRVIRAKLKGR